MKNINEQIDRIKQLFTEERLHGNLIENDNDTLLTEQEQQKKKYNRGVQRAKRKLERKLRRAKSKEEMDKAQEKFNQKTSQLWADYTKNPKGFNTRKLLFKGGELKLYGHKDKTNELMLVSLGEGMGVQESSDKAIALIKSYFKEKFGKDVEDIEVTLMTNNKFKSGKEYIIFSVIDNSDFLPPQEDKGSEEPKAEPEVKAEPEAKAEPEVKAEPEAKGDKVSGVKSPQPEKSEGDFTRPLQKLGGAQEGYRYILTGKNDKGQLTAKKVDSKGKTISTYVRESKFNKKSLFESAYSFDIKNTITENWKWIEGKGGEGQTFSDSLSKKFDDAINQVDSDASSSAKSEKPSDADNQPKDDEKPSDADKKDGWEQFPCITNIEDKKLTKTKGGSPAYLIDGVFFYTNGRCSSEDGTKMLSYKCEGNKIIVDGKEWSPKPKDDKSVSGKPKKIPFKWESARGESLTVSNDNVLVDLNGIDEFVNGMVDSLDPVIKSADIKSLLTNLELVQGIKIMKKEKYSTRPQYCGGDCKQDFVPNMSKEGGELLPILLLAYKKDESGDTVSGDIKEILDNISEYPLLDDEETQKMLQQILNIVKNYQ